MVRLLSYAIKFSHRDGRAKRYALGSGVQHQMTQNGHWLPFMKELDI